MTRPLPLLLLAGSAALGLWIWTDLEQPDAPTSPTAASRSPTATAAALPDATQRRPEVATILARPLFSPTRRPKTDIATADTAAPIVALPRMSAILINGSLRSAIFDAGGKPTVLGEGGHLGPFTVQSIAPQAVTMLGPSGPRVVRPTFSNDPPPAMPPSQLLPQALLPPSPVQVILPPGMPTPAGAAR